MQLYSTRKENMTISEYCTKMRHLVSELATGGTIVSNEYLCHHIIIGHNISYESMVVSLPSRLQNVSFEELYSILLSHQVRLEQHATNEAQVTYEANMAIKHNKCRMNEKNKDQGKGYNLNQGSRNSYGGRGSNKNSFRERGKGRYKGNKIVLKPIITCQICFKVGHTTDECWYKHVENFLPKNNNQQHQRAAFIAANE